MPVFGGADRGRSIFLPEPVEIASQSLAAILSTWLGLTVVSRAPTQRAPRVFGWVTLLLLVWSVAILIERTTSLPLVAQRLNYVEDAAAFLLPAAALHIVLAFTAEGPYARWQTAALSVAYAVGGLVLAHRILDPGHPLNVTPPYLTIGGMPGPLLGWAWIGFRITVFACAIGLAANAYASAGSDQSRRGQTLAALVTISLASLGGTLRFLPREIGGPNWFGVSFITLALIVATYAVFGQGVFLSQRAVRNAFRYSLLAGIAVAIYVGILAGLEASVEPVLHTTFPIVLLVALVATVALQDPVREWLQALIAWRSPQELAFRRLARALGSRTLAEQSPEVAIQPAVERLGRFIGFASAEVVGDDGVQLASVGRAPPSGTAQTLTLPVAAAGRRYGEARFSRRQDDPPYTQRERTLLTEAAGYFGAALHLGHLRTEQAAALSALGSEQVALNVRGTELSESLLAPPQQARLRVFAFGPMRVERDGVPVTNWGGPKAGSRQAEAIFAFLFDRGDRGVSKDEIIDVVWPDVDLERADLAFHRTLVGLRSVLEPGRPHRGADAAIGFHNDRYRLNGALVGWSDVAAFTDLIAKASAATDAADGIRLLEEARSLIRGDYLDDCPFYGDSEYVEERRRLLRGEQVALLVTLGERYETRGDRPSAALAFREALGASGEECPPALAGLGRLGVPA